MDNKLMNNNIRNAFNNLPVEGLDRILKDCKKVNRVVTYEEKKPSYNWLPKLAIGMACAVLVISSLFFSNVFMSNGSDVAAVISLDVNPSIEIKINKKEKVLDVLALNEDAKVIIGDMDFKGSDLDVAVNALIGSLIRNGYLDDLQNSILVSVEDINKAEAKNLEDKLVNEISALLEKGSVLAQQVKNNDEIKALAERFNITLGKAQLIKELADQTTLYSYEDLAKLSINELNLLSRSITDSNIQRNGDPSDKAYIGIEKAKEIALSDLGVSAADVVFKKTELDFENRTMVYEIEFVNNNVEYEYVIDALDGEIIYVDREYERKNSTYNPQPSTNVDNAGMNNLIGEAKAKQIALANAGVSESQIKGLRIVRDYDDGIVKYEIDFYVDNIEYEYEINAKTGAIIKVEKDQENDYRPTASSKPGVYNYDGNTYKVVDGVVYEYDDGKWEVERDKKVVNGVVYEYDDGKWEVDDDDDDDRYDRDDDRYDRDDDRYDHDDDDDDDDDRYDRDDDDDDDDDDD